MIKDMQEDIRLEQLNEKRGGTLEEEDMKIRKEQLQQTREILSELWDAYLEDSRNAEDEENWARYVTCDGLPDPGSLADMNTFIFVWRMENEQASMDTVAEKCQMITNVAIHVFHIRLLGDPLLIKLQAIVRFSMTISKKYITEYEVIAKELRSNLQRWIDLACYRLLRNIEENMIREDIKTSRYVLAANDVICCVWAPIPLPIGKSRFGDKEKPYH
ncbi:dynein axonemal intermediate chain 7-like [Calliopsis andreniformis]|uniref:dynein axonemal intermediate chain 7-like n=1 Tax=Calliopsis andreniformis TaxID=337506 RepID=UPI003FCCE50B